MSPIVICNPTTSEAFFALTSILQTATPVSIVLSKKLPANFCPQNPFPRQFPGRTWAIARCLSAGQRV
jgi:hypothetical protein